MPRSSAASTVRRSARVPSRCPASTGRPRPLAHRPFPSMMIATDRGTSDGSSAGRPRPKRSRIRRRSVSAGHSDFGDLGFLAFEQLVDLAGVLVRQLLNALLGPPLLVLADIAFCLQLLQMPIDVAPHVAHGHAPVLRD